MPNAKDFVGSFETEFDGQQCWKAIGDIRVSYLDLSSKITAYLEMHSEPLAVGAVLWTLRMIGETPETARPTVIFCCRDERHRTAAMEAIKKSCILEDYPVFALRHSPQAPMSTNGLVMMSGSVAKDPLQLSRQEDLALHWSPPTISESDIPLSEIPTGQRKPKRDSPKQLLKTVAVPVYSKGPNLGSGSSLLTEDAKMARDGAQATVGGGIRLHGRSYIMTAAHPFTQVPLSPQIRDTETPTCHSRAESDPENNRPSNGKDQNGCEDPEAVAERSSSLRRTTTSLPTSAHQFHAGDGETSPLHHQMQLLLPVGNLWFSSMVDSLPELDYALVAPTGSVPFRADLYSTAGTLASRQHRYLQFPKFASKKALQCTVGTRAYTKAASSPTAEGEFDPMPAFIRLPNTQKYQEVYSVKFSHALAKGDCGAWVLKTSSKSLLGHIVAGSPADGLVYIVPFYQVAEDMENVFQLPPSPEYDPSYDGVYNQSNRLGISHDGGLSPTMQSQRRPGPYDAVGYIRRDGAVFDRDELYEEYRPYDPYDHDSYDHRN